MKLERDRLAVDWTPELEGKVRKLLRTYRFEPRGGTDSPQQVVQSLRTECALLDRLIEDLRLTLTSSQPETLDLSVIAAVDRLREIHQTTQP